MSISTPQRPVLRRTDPADRLLFTLLSGLLLASSTADLRRAATG
jgi:hypothetical protein